MAKVEEICALLERKKIEYHKGVLQDILERSEKAKIRLAKLTKHHKAQQERKESHVKTVCIHILYIFFR